jgi:carbon-monoxide dehydrogenase medium subunit
LPSADIPFTSPTSLEAALQELSGENAVAVAGGTSLALLLKNDLVTPGRLVSLRRVPGLSEITMRGDWLRLGAMVTLRALASSPLVRTAAPILAEAAAQVGNPRVRSVATVGGAIAHADPRQDIPPVLLALGAHACLSGPGGPRTVPMSEFFAGFMETAAREDEVITDVVLPARAGTRQAYVRFTPNSRDDYPVVCVAAVVSLAEDGSAESARIAVGGVGTTAVLAVDAANLLVGRCPGRSVMAASAATAAAAVDPGDDRRGSPGYKRAMTEVWVRRALERCLPGPAPPGRPGGG